MSGAEPSKNYTMTYSASQLKPGKSYSFLGQAIAGSAETLIKDGARVYSNAVFVGHLDGNLEFKFNRMHKLIITPTDNQKFTYMGFTPHNGGLSARKSRRNRKSRRQQQQQQQRRN